MSVLIRNIKSLIGVRDTPEKPLRGMELNESDELENAFLLIEDGLIKDFGANTEAPDRAEEVIDASNRYVIPAWCDSHTHLVYAQSRENEFVDRIKGLSYEEIAAKGGGIVNSAIKLRNTDENVLFDSAQARLEEIQSQGTGAVEIKSGYGLSPESELKMLRVIRKLKEKNDIPIKSTFLGAHAYPPEFKNDHQGYIELIIEKMLPQIKDEGLADYIDVFCETNYFSSEDTDKILNAGVKAGLTPKIHVNQFSTIGGIETAIKYDALSVDHLEVLSVQDIEVLKQSSTIATLLPSCSFFINIPYAQGRKLISAGIPIALASDYNPGSTPSGNIPFVLSLASIKMKLLPMEAINAVTINGAFAMGIEKEMGSIARGKKASLVITEKMESIASMTYEFGSKRVWRKI